MGIFCLVKEKADRFREALKDGTIDPEKLVNMSSEDRNAFFGKIVGEENAKNVNALFESKLLLKNQQQGLVNWAKSVGMFNVAAKRDLISRIEKMDTVLRANNEQSFLRDLAEQKLGTAVTYEQAQKITELTGKLKKLSSEKDEIGNHSLEYFEQLRKTKEYIQSLTPTGPLARAAATFRNSMLTAPHIPIKVTVETSLNRAIEETVKAIVYRGKGENSDLAYRYTKTAREIYSKTGFNIGSMNSLDEGNMFGDNFAHFEGPGLIRKGQKALDRAVIHYGHGLLFNAHYNGTFASTINAETSRVARQEGLTGTAAKSRAETLSKEALTIGTRDPIAADIRAKAQQDAMRATNTNDTYGSRMGKFMKNTLNAVAPPLHLGDLTIAFSKIPGNIIANSIEVAGGGLAKGALQFKAALSEAKRTGKSADLIAPIKTMVRMAGGLGVATLIGSQISQDNYDEKKQMIRLGGVWVSTELLGPIGPAVNGFLQAKFAKPDESKLKKYGMGALEGLKNLPGIKEIGEIYEYGVPQFLKGFATGRVPGLFKDIAQAYTQGSDEYNKGGSMLGIAGRAALPIMAGSKVVTTAQKQLETFGTSDTKQQDALDRVAQTKTNTNAGTDDIVKRIQNDKKFDRDTAKLTAALKNQIKKAQTAGTLTASEAERASEVLGYKVEPSPDEKEVAPKGSHNAEGFIDTLTTYADALGTDPMTAFNRIFHGERIIRLDNGTIIVRRMTLGESSKVKRDRGSSGKEMRLDHTESLEVGGDNSPENLRLVPKEVWESYTPIENFLGNALRRGKIKGEKARQLMRDFKDGKITKQDLIKEVGEPFNGSDH